MKIINPQEITSLPELSAQDARALLSESGILWFRGFKAPLSEFRRFMSVYPNKRIDSDPSEREAHATFPEIQTVDLHSHAINWHCEFGSSPLRPDVIGFYCAEPGLGGETCVCDGVKIWNDMENALREFFTTEQLLFTFEGNWSQLASFFGVSVKELPSTRSESLWNRTFSTIVPDFEMKFHDKGFSSTWQPFAVNTLDTGDRALASNLFPGVYQDIGSTARLRNGEHIPAGHLKAIEEIIRKRAIAIPWKQGDFALIDNNRVLHARNEPGPGREMFACFGYKQENSARINQLYQLLLSHD